MGWREMGTHPMAAARANGSHAATEAMSVRQMRHYITTAQRCYSQSTVTSQTMHQTMFCKQASMKQVPKAPKVIM
jgi:hypothetical protein